MTHLVVFLRGILFFFPLPLLCSNFANSLQAMGRELYRKELWRA